MKKIFKSILVFVIFGLILVNFTGCLDKNLKEVDEANIIYTGESIKWDMVKNADGYEVSINGNTPVDTKALSYPYKQGGDFTFEITAYRLDKDGNKQHSESVIVSFTELGIVEEIKIKDGVVTWNAVEGANAYKIRLNGTELAENFAVREFAELNYGKNSIEIRAINVDNSRAYSVWSDILQFELLSSPTNIKYDSEQKLLYWDVVKDASKYEVVIDGTRKELVVNNSFAFDPNKKDFTVSVKAVGDEMNHVYDSPYCEPKEFIYLPQVENLTMKDGELVWNGSEKAVGYKLKIDNILQDYVLDQPKFSNIVPGESYYISILQVSDQTAYYSEWSEPVSITICVAPQIRYEDGVIAWTGVSNATGYKVNLSLNGNPINVPNLSNQETIYLNDFSQPGTYKISVQTLSDPEKGSFDSKFSNEIEVIRLEKPSTGRVYDITTQINETYITFDSVLNAYNYEVKINGTESKVLSSSPFYFKDSQHYTDISAESAIKVEIYSVGDGQSHSDGKVVLGSTTGLEFTLTKVATPTTVEIENSTIKWDYIPHANGYVVDINGKTYYPQTNQLILPEGMSAGEHNVHVRALGNGSEYISSNTSKGITFTKLQTPSELEIVEGVLKWRAVNGAEKYFVKVGEYTTEVVNNSFVIEDQYISTSGVAIYVKAIGNNSTKVDSDMNC